MNDQARRGKHLILAIIAVYFLLELLLLVFEVAANALPPNLSSLVRLGLSAVLAYYLYLGRDWARWAWGLLLLLGILVGLALGGSFPDTTGAQPVVLLFSCAGLIYFLGAALFLFLSPDVRQYMDYRRTRTAMSSPLH